MSGEGGAWRAYLGSWDLETSGVEVFADRVVTSTLLTVRGKETSAREWLVNPGVLIPEGASNVHGITTEKAQAEGADAATSVLEIWQALLALWDSGAPLVIYNASYDVSLLLAELARHHSMDYVETARLVGPIIDPMVIDKKLNQFVRGKGARKLINCATRYGVVLSEEDAHSSAGDTLAAARIAWKMSTLAPVMAMSLEALQGAQREWSAEQNRDFANYLRTKASDAEGADRVISEIGWPVRPWKVPEELDGPTDEIPF